MKFEKTSTISHPPAAVLQTMMDAIASGSTLRLARKAVTYLA